MNVWTIRFLGVPCALRDGQPARLRSKETWAVLASLILPSLLREDLYPAVSRQTLADRFWSDSQAVEPRTHLRQCLASLRDAFGEHCLNADRHDVQVAPGWFTTDVEQALMAHRNALNAASAEERLHWLTEAEAQIRGEFFEGWTPDSDEAQVWLIHLRADIRNRLTSILLLLAETLEAADNPNGACDIVRTLLRFQPGHPEARQRAWRLATAAGQQDVMYALEHTETFREAVSKYPVGSLNAGTLSDQRLFRSLFASELNKLPTRLRKQFLRLSILAAPFSPELAGAACRVSFASLTSLSKTPLIETRHGMFSLPEVVRECAWKQVPSATRRRLQRRLAVCCVEWLLGMHQRPGECPPPFDSLEQAAPFVKPTLDWVLAQKPTLEFLAFLNMLRYHGLIAPGAPVVAYFGQARQDEALPAEMRLQAAASAAYALMQMDQHARAVLELEAGLPIAASISTNDWMTTLYESLMIACHYAEDSDSAVVYASRTLSLYRLHRDSSHVAGCLRFLGEINNHLENFEQALGYCEEALSQRRANAASGPQIADALYWKAKSLFRLERWKEAADTIEETLSLWQKAGDITGVGFCLRLIGQLRCVEGRYAEARSHLEYAVYLHEQTGSTVNRLAAVEALGDVLHADRQHEAARSHYEECLTAYTEKQQPANVERIKTKLAGCPE